MRRYYQHLLGLFIAVFSLSTVCFGLGSPTMTLENSYKRIEKSSDSCFILGSFKILHTLNPEIIPPELANYQKEINYSCDFKTKIDLVNLENQKSYKIDLKPITGSSTIYYPFENQLTKNTANPYWILEVPAGTYRLDTVICRYSIRLPGYNDFDAHLFDAPVNRLILKKIMINALPNQIVYIGDYQAALKTFMLLANGNYIYPLRQFELSVKDDFEAAKAALLNGANDKVKAKINQMEMVSALTPN